MELRKIDSTEYDPSHVEDCILSNGACCDSLVCEADGEEFMMFVQYDKDGGLFACPMFGESIYGGKFSELVDNIEATGIQVLGRFVY